MKHNIKLNNYYLAIMFLFSFVISSEFANTIFFVPLRYVFYFFMLFFFFKNVKYMDKSIILIFLSIFIISFTRLIWAQQGTQILATNMLFILPFCFIDFNLFNNIKVAARYTFITAIFILLLWRFADFLNQWNDNSIAMLLYYGLVSIFFMLSDSIKRKLSVIIIYSVTIVLVAATSSRNMILSMFVVAIIVLFPKIFTKKIIYRLTYLLSILYSYISIHISFFILENEKIFNKLLYLSNEYFGKNTVFDGRIALLEYGMNIINENPIDGLFGHGYLIYGLKFAPHNNYLALTYAYGIIGTILTAIFLIIIFEKAYKLISNGNHSAYVSSAILVGVFLQLGAESFMYGNDILILMPYIYMTYIVKMDIKTRFFTFRKVVLAND